MAKDSTATTAPKRQRSTGSANLIAGMMVLPVDVVSQKRSGVDDDGAFRSICPACAADTSVTVPLGLLGLAGDVPVEGHGPTAVRVSQQYVCSEAHGPFTQGDLLKGRELDADHLVAVDPDLVAFVNEGPTPQGDLMLEVVPAAAVEAATRPGAYGYRLRPKKDAGPTLKMLYALIRELAADGDRALIGKLRLRGATRFYRLGVWRGVLMLTELLYTDEVAEPEDLSDCVATDKVLAMGKQWADAALVDFDPAEWQNEKLARMGEVDAKLAAGEMFVPPVVEDTTILDAEAAALALLTGALATGALPTAAPAADTEVEAEAEAEADTEAAA